MYLHQQLIDNVLLISYKKLPRLYNMFVYKIINKNDCYLKEWKKYEKFPNTITKLRYQRNSFIITVETSTNLQSQPDYNHDRVNKNYDYLRGDMRRYFYSTTSGTYSTSSQYFYIWNRIAQAQQQQTFLTGNPEVIIWSAKQPHRSARSNYKNQQKYSNSNSNCNRKRGR